MDYAHPVKLLEDLVGAGQKKASLGVRDMRPHSLSRFREAWRGAGLSRIERRIPDGLPAQENIRSEFDLKAKVWSVPEPA